MTLTKRHKAFFEAARAVSKLSDFPRNKLGCVAVYKHRIISSGCNQTKTHPLQKRMNKCRFDADTTHSIHAEISCLSQLIGRKDIDFKDMSLYIYRSHANGSAALSKPCAGCMALIRELGIRNIYYTGECSYIHEELI